MPVSLIHTFSTGCEGEGDEVDDTPLEDFASNWPSAAGCQEQRDSCPDAPGLDPVHNMCVLQLHLFDRSIYSSTQLQHDLLGLPH
jgi:hypothetical protein